MYKIAGIGLFLCCLAALLVWRVTIPLTLLSHRDSRLLKEPGDPAKGFFVFQAGGCASCHQSQTSPSQEHVIEGHPPLLGGGRAFKTPFGTFFAPNISPHLESGIGHWTVLDLARALLFGVSPKGEHYYPAFPYTTYAHLHVEDIRDLYAYLRTLPPVEGHVNPHDVSFPFSVRRFLGLWKVLYFDTTPLQADPSQSPAWNRGHYLVEALAHCAECHSPRTLLGGIDRRKRFAGGPNIGERGYAPNLTPAQDGLKTWSQEEIRELLTTGFTPDFDQVGGSMAEVVRNTRTLPESDRDAIATYIKALPPIPNPHRP